MQLLGLKAGKKSTPAKKSFVRPKVRRLGFSRVLSLSRVFAYA